MTMLIDGLQYANWSERIFRQMRDGGVDAVHVSITYHETFRETVLNISRWNRWFEDFPDLIFQGFSAADVQLARNSGRTAIFFGAQNPSCIEDDIGLVEVLHRLGLRFMQLTYNNQSLLATGCYEAEDTGLTRMGRDVVTEMNRVGLVVDMSHSAERSTLDAIAHSSRPIAITHANPATWHPARRNKSPRVLQALAESDGMVGFSLYPHHLNGGSACTLDDFCGVVARTRSAWTISASAAICVRISPTVLSNGCGSGAGRNRPTMARAAPLPLAFRRCRTGFATIATSGRSGQGCAASG